jgi:hypothetical protein
MNINQNTVEVRRGGMVQYFLYLPLFIIFGWAATLLPMPVVYRYMIVAVLSVGAGYYLQPYIFRKPVIVLYEDGIFTSRLGKILWNDIREIQLEKTSSFSTRGIGRTHFKLVIETKQGRTNSYNGDYLNVDIQQFYALVNNYRNRSNSVT